MIDAAAESTYKAADAMMERGGSFVKELGAAWYVADPINKARLCMAFNNYFVKYGAKDDARSAVLPLSAEFQLMNGGDDYFFFLHGLDIGNREQEGTMKFSVKDVIDQSSWAQIAMRMRDLLIEGLKVSGHFPEQK